MKYSSIVDGRLKMEKPIYIDFKIVKFHKSNNYFKLSILFCFFSMTIIYFFLFKKKSFNINFNYIDYENNIITDEIRDKAGCLLSKNQINFINGIIRKYKPQNCLEIGVANGGSSILILNAIKDIPHSFLISLDLYTQLYINETLKTGYRVNKYFPELLNKWKLFTGDQPHKFLIKLNMKFDFVFLDTAHRAPGELLNFIEILPFLNENAIIILHDILIHFKYKSILYPSNSLLYPIIYGNKLLLKKKNNSIENIGAVFLYKNQRKHYLDYFLLLLNFWQYMPSEKEINDLRLFIKKYYKKNIYLSIFNAAVIKNKISIKNHNNHTNGIKLSIIKKKLNSRYF